jgi:hypothetical protein
MKLSNNCQFNKKFEMILGKEQNKKLSNNVSNFPQKYKIAYIF